MIQPDVISATALCKVLSLDPKVATQCSKGWLHVGKSIWPVTVLPDDQAAVLYVALIGNGYPVEQAMLGTPQHEYEDALYELEVSLQKDQGRALNLLAVRAATWLMVQRIEEIASHHQMTWAQTYQGALKYGFHPVPGWLSSFAPPYLYGATYLNTTASDMAIAWMLARNVLVQQFPKQYPSLSSLGEPPLYPGETGYLSTFAAMGAHTYPDKPIVLVHSAQGLNPAQDPENPTPPSSTNVVVRIYRDQILWNSCDQLPYDFATIVGRAMLTLETALLAMSKPISGGGQHGSEESGGKHPFSAIEQFGNPAATAASLAKEEVDQAEAAANAATKAYTADPTNPEKQAAAEATAAAYFAAVEAQKHPSAANSAKLADLKKAAALAIAAAAASGPHGGNQGAKDQEEKPAGMSTGTKVAIGVGVAGALGLTAWKLGWLRKLKGR
jgi:hypothetical protein